MDLKRLNPLWRQLPVYSPVTFRSLWAGLAGALGFGDPLARLQALLMDEYGCRDLILTDSGTSALRLAIQSAIERTGSDIVALPAYCCFDVATAAVGAGARVALYDVRPDTLGPDFETLREALESGARSVVVAHLYGIPVDLERSRAVCEEYEAVLVEDAAQGAGGAWRGRPLGAHGDLAVLSFGRGKGRTGGGGGCLLANTQRGGELLRSIRSCPPTGRGFNELAKLSAQWLFGRPWLYGIPASLPFLGIGETVYKEPRTPRSIAPGAAAALLRNWGPSKQEEIHRRAVRVPLPNGCRLPAPAEPASAISGALRVAVLTPDGMPHHGSRYGIAQGYPTGLQVLSALRGRLVRSGSLPGSQRLTRQLVTVPVHSRIGKPVVAKGLLTDQDPSSSLNQGSRPEPGDRP